MELANQNTLIVGLGKSGIAAGRFLKNKGACVTITDKADEKELSAYLATARESGIEMELGRHEIASFETADLIVVSPGVPHTIEPIIRAKHRGVPVIGEIELAYQFIREPIIAITGTNGKTTTTELVGEMLESSGFKVFVGGNIGNALIGYADQEEKAEIVVAEVSSFQLDTIDTFKPKVAVLLNITEDHLDRYPDFQAYAAAKGRIFENQQADDTAVLNGSDTIIRTLSKDIKSRKFFFNCHEAGEAGARINGQTMIIGLSPETEIEIDLSAIKLTGRHNMENAAAACLAALAAGGTIAGIQSALMKFKGLAHRLEYVDTIDNIKYFDDSKATNVGAVARALESFRNPVVLIMGGRDKGGSYHVLKDLVERHTKALILLGEAKERIKSALGHIVPTREASTMKEAVLLARQAAVPGDAILLSCACSSFDMYRSYAERGEAFRRVVADLKKTHA